MPAYAVAYEGGCVACKGVRVACAVACEGVCVVYAVHACDEKYMRDHTSKLPDT